MNPLSSNKTQDHELERILCRVKTLSGVHIHYRHVLVLLVPPLRRPPFVLAKGENPPLRFDPKAGPNHESGNTCSCLLRDSAVPRRRVISCRTHIRGSEFIREKPEQDKTASTFQERSGTRKSLFHGSSGLWRDSAYGQNRSRHTRNARRVGRPQGCCSGFRA